MPYTVTFSPSWRLTTTIDDLGFLGTADTIGGLVQELQARLPNFSKHVLDEQGKIRRHVNFYVNEVDIRFLQNQETPIKDGDEICIVPAIVASDSAIAAITVATQLREKQNLKTENDPA